MGFDGFERVLVGLRIGQLAGGGFSQSLTTPFHDKKNRENAAKMDENFCLELGNVGK